MSTATARADGFPFANEPGTPIPYVPQACVLAAIEADLGDVLLGGTGLQYRLFIQWEHKPGHRELPSLTSNDQDEAISMAKLASSFRNVRYVAVYSRGNAYPVALVIGGQDMDWDLEDALAFMG
jgi:hypothetical protein